MANEYDFTPRPVRPVKTPFRTIQTAIPAPGSLPVLKRLYRGEPLAMRGQPPILWQRAEGFQVHDGFGNTWVDWSSGVLIANAGHANERIRRAIAAQVEKHLLSNYCFPNTERADLVDALRAQLPAPLDKIFLLTTGSEAIECTIKLARAWGLRQRGRDKHVIVSFDKAFHGRTLGAQQAGGIPALKDWIVNLDPGFVQLPFPDGFWTKDTSFEQFERGLHERGIEPDRVAAVLTETYQGGSAAFAPPLYMQQVREWCTRHRALLICDEVQAGFGRTGRMWGFEHYGIVPDLTTFGKGISSSLPISAVAGRAEILDQFPPGSMTSTHTGNPVCCAAALASLQEILERRLVQNAAEMGDSLHRSLRVLQSADARIGAVLGKGLVAGFICVRPETGEPDGELAWDIARRTIEQGVLLFSPVGYRGSTVKIAPPLCITKEALEDSLAGFGAAVGEALEARQAVAR
jgi:4-aminobutyrate aminotransferase/(S)-3-amino-2-methylpropionate transaminase